ncbi:MAG: hypothetical protein HOK99_07825 [Betaproteobacteria bacterium]|nr:hypothetical protein [Betaproteobacteria bacterium]
MNRQEVVDLHSINWPQKCAYCNASADGAVKAKSSAVKKARYFILFLQTTSRVIELDVPVCKSHRIKAAVASWLSQRSMLSLGLGVLSVFMVLGPIGEVVRFLDGAEQINTSTGWRAFTYVFPITYWALFFWAKNNTPILIEDQKEKIFFRFRSDEFANEFGRLNGGT